MASLIVIDGPEKGKTFSLDKANLVMVGRDHGCTFQLLDPKLSRMHLQIKRLDVPAGHAAIDFQSSNGVFVNGSRIEAETRLAAGDLIQIGDTSILYSNEDDPQSASVEERLRRIRQGTMSTQLEN